VAKPGKVVKELPVDEFEYPPAFGQGLWDELHAIRRLLASARQMEGITVEELWKLIDVMDARLLRLVEQCRKVVTQAQT